MSRSRTCREGCGRMRLRLELFVDDIDTTLAFYTGLLGFTLDRAQPGYASIRRGQIVLGLGRIADLPAVADGPGFSRARLSADRGGGVEIVLEVDDIDELAALHE